MTEEPPKKTKRAAVVAVIWVVIALLFIWFLLWFFHFRWREYTDDAYVSGNRILVKPQVAGSITAFFADDNDLVKEGDLLVTLDKTPFEVDLSYQKQNLALAVRQARVLKENVGEKLAELSARKAELQKAQDDFDNRQAVIAQLAVSGEEVQHASADLLAAHANYESVEKQLESAIAAYGAGPVAEHPTVLAQVEQVKRSYLNLWYCDICSPVTGFVAKRAAQIGDWALPTNTLMSVVPYDQMWVEANYKETQLKYVRIGQPVIVTTDLYGSGTEFHGSVQGISSGTGSVFSLIPPQNATGNWIKIVQRLPVRIILDPEEVKRFPLRLGLSTETWVSLRDTTGPAIGSHSPRVPIEKTWIFDVNLKPIEMEIAQIIKENLTEVSDASQKYLGESTVSPLQEKHTGTLDTAPLFEQRPTFLQEGSGLKKDGHTLDSKDKNRKGARYDSSSSNEQCFE